MKKIVEVHISEIESNIMHNVSRIVKNESELFSSDSDRIELAESLSQGWDPLRGVVGVYQLTPDEVKTAVKIREDRLAELQAATVEYTVGKDLIVTSQNLLENFEREYVKNGIIITPVYGVVYGYRRMASVTLAMAISQKTTQVDVSLVPCVVIDATKKERDIQNVQENSLKMVGVKSLTTSDKLKAAQRLYEQGATESVLGKVWKRGTAQKLFGLCKLNAAHKELNIINFIISDKYKLGSFDKEIVRKIVSEGWSQTKVEEWLENPKKINSSKIAKGADVKSLAKQSTVLAINYIAGAVADNKLDSLASLLDKKEELNAAWTAIMAGQRLYTQDEVEQAIKDSKKSKKTKK